MDDEYVQDAVIWSRRKTDLNSFIADLLAEQLTALYYASVRQHGCECVNLHWIVTMV